MPRSSATGNLFITVGGDVTPLKAAMTAGKSVLNEFGNAAIDVQAEVAKAFASMAANAPAEAKQLEQSYVASFAQIRKNAQAALNAPNGASAVDIVNATAMREATGAAEGQAAALRLVANAAASADAAQQGNNAGLRAYSLAAEANAQQAEEYAAGLRAQATALGLVQDELVATGAAEQRLNVAQEGAVGRTRGMNIAQMELMHVVRGSVDQLAAGASATQVLAMHMSMLGQAAALSGESMGAFGKFMGGPYGLLLTVGVSVLAMLISKHHDGAKAANDHRTAEDTLTAYIHGEKIATDTLLDSLKKLNDERSRGLDLTGEATRREIDLVKATLDQAQAQRLVLAGQLSQAKASLATAERQAAASSGGGKGALEAAGGDIARQQGEVDALQSSLDDLDKTIGYASGALADDITKLARNLSTAVGRANDQFDQQQAALEARYRGTPTYSKAANGTVTTTLHGGLLNASGITNDRRIQLTAQLAVEEHNLNVAREKAVQAAQALDKAEVGQAQSASEAISKFREALVGAEGVGANRQGSSAFGVGQFMPATWEHYYAKAYGNPHGLSSQQIDAFRDKPTIAAGVIEVAAKDYAEKLKAAGIQVTEASLYAFHMLSAGTSGSVAIKLLKAPDDASARSIVGNRVVAQNGNIFTGTVGQARSEIGRRIGDSGSAVSSGATAIDQDLKDQAQKSAEQLASFTMQLDGLNDKILSAVGQIAGDYQQQANSALAQVQSEKKLQADKIAQQLAEGKYGDATGKLAQNRSALLNLANEQLAQQRTTNILVQEFNNRIDDQKKSLDQDSQFKIDALNELKSNARTADERLQLDLQIIAATYEYRRQLLELNKKLATENQDWDEVNRINSQIADLPAQQARDTRNAHKADMTPLQAYRDTLPKNLADIEEKLQQIEVTGLKGLEDDAANATAKLLGLKGTVAELAGELAKLGIQLLESYAAGNNPLAGLFGGHRALGGGVNDNQFYVVGEHGPEIFAPGRSGTIIPNHVLSSTAPRGLSRGSTQASAGWRRTAPMTQIWNISTPDSDSFRRSRGQMLREERRRR